VDDLERSLGIWGEEVRDSVPVEVLDPRRLGPPSREPSRWLPRAATLGMMVAAALLAVSTATRLNDRAPTSGSNLGGSATNAPTSPDRGSPSPTLQVAAGYETPEPWTLEQLLAGCDDDVNLPDMAKRVALHEGSDDAVFYVTGSHALVCAVGLDFRGNPASYSAFTTIEALKGDVSIDMSPQMNPEQGPRFSTTVGRVSERVATVTIVLMDNSEIAASTKGGYYLAWWPSDVEVKAVTARSKGGAILGSVSPDVSCPMGC
jgi:hypothetical protein